MRNLLMIYLIASCLFSLDKNEKVPQYDVRNLTIHSSSSASLTISVTIDEHDVTLDDLSYSINGGSYISFSAGNRSTLKAGSQLTFTYSGAVGGNNTLQLKGSFESSVEPRPGPGGEDKKTFIKYSAVESFQLPVSLALSYPNSSVTLNNGATINITWSDNLAGNVKLELFKAGVLNHTISSSTASDGSFSWTIPGSIVSGSDYKIRVSDLNSSSNDESNANFTIEPAVTISASSTGNYYPGNTSSVTWSRSSAASYVKIYLGSNGAKTHLISDNNSGSSLNYTLPYSIMADEVMKFTIDAYNSSNQMIGSTTSSNSFWLKEKLDISSTIPASGLRKGHNYTIQWNKNTGAQSTIRIISSGQVKKTYTVTNSAQNSYLWTIPMDLIIGGGYEIEVLSGSVSQKTSYFTLSEDVLTLSSPSANDVLLQTGHNINWSHNFQSSSPVRVVLMQGQTEVHVISSSTTNQSLTWNPMALIKEHRSGNLKIKVETLSGRLPHVEVLSGTFQIADFVDITSNLNSTYNSDDVINLTWNYTNNLVNRFKVFFFVEGASQGQGSAYLSTNQYSYTVPKHLLAGQNYYFKIVAYHYPGSGTTYTEKGSDITGMFQTNPGIQIQHPLGGSGDDNGEDIDLRKGHSYKIEWIDNFIGSVKIDLYKNNVFQQTITSTAATTALPTGSSYNWLIPDNLVDGSDYKIKITNNASSVSSESPANFKISADQVTVVSPNGGWLQHFTENLPISWTDNFNLTDDLKIELLKDNVVVQTITSSRYASEAKSLSWPIPSNFTSGQDYKIRITNNKSVSISSRDESDLAFTISGKVLVYSPGGFKSYLTAENLKVTWWKHSDVKKVDVLLYKAGSQLEKIGEVSDGNDFNWVIPLKTTTGNDYQIRLLAYNESATEIASSLSANFTITQNLDLNYVKSYSLMEKVSSSTNPASLPRDSVAIRTSYTDLMGRAYQSVAHRVSNTGKDIVQHIEYDERGIQSKEFLPYKDSGSNGKLKLSSATDQQAYYAGTGYDNTKKIQLTNSPFSITKTEQSPMMHVYEKGAVGDDWQPNTSDLNGKTVKTFLRSNNVADAVRLFNAENGLSSSIYGDNTLVINRNIDENNKESREYKDKSDKVVLKESFNNGIKLRTYYVYDDRGNLRYIIPPELTKSIPANNTTAWNANDHLNTYVTKFEYDSENRLIKKWTPDAKWVYTAYDKLGRAAMVQDENLRAKSPEQWLFTKYDRHGRIIYTGLISDVGNFATVQAALDAETEYWEEIDAGSELGYTGNRVFPLISSMNTILSVTYYDHYTENPVTKNLTLPNQVLNQDVRKNRLFGTVLATKTRILSGNDLLRNSIDWPYSGNLTVDNGDNIILTDNNLSELVLLPETEIIVSNGSTVEIGIALSGGKKLEKARFLSAYSLYDDYGRVIEAVSDNAVGGKDSTITEYEKWSGGKIKKTESYHWKAGQEANPNYVKSTPVYDQLNRVAYTNIERKFNGTVYPSYVPAISHYNELGEVYETFINPNPVKISQNSTTGIYEFDGSNQADYLYKTESKKNERGWMTEIQAKNGTSNIFREKLAYQKSTLSSAVPNLSHNGNITGMEIWQNNGTNDVHYQYNYQYDDINQLKLADYLAHGNAGSSGDYTTNNLSYDLNGNIKTLSRYRAGLMDNLIYNYKNADKSNRIDRIDDNIADNLKNGSYGFKDLVEQANEYEYDVNGNMTKDLNKGIDLIEYNHLNLPVRFKFNSGFEIHYEYDAGGGKISRKEFTSSGTKTKEYVYSGSFVYESHSTGNPLTLSFMSTGDGRLKNNNGTVHEEYFLKDHLGNTRITLKSNVAARSSFQYLQNNHYYAFGLTIEDLSTTISPESENRLTYNGKEYDRELKWYHYGARFYDPQVGRWWTVDPAGQFYSPFNYVGNDPINMIDPDGMVSTHTNKKGDVIAVYNDGDLGVYRHDNIESSAQWSGDKLTGGELVGSTAVWWSFTKNGPDASNIIPVGKIDFGSTWARDKVRGILALDLTFPGYAIGARSGGRYDLKRHTPNGSEYYGSLLQTNGIPIYVSARDAGNYAAGLMINKTSLPSNFIWNGYGTYNLTGNRIWATALLMYDIYTENSMGLKTQIENTPYHGEDARSGAWIKFGEENRFNLGLPAVLRR